MKEKKYDFFFSMGIGEVKRKIKLNARGSFTVPMQIGSRMNINQI